ncbi:uncharacterized protein LOC133796210 [Humulus lupulus]|uniref:uncharacterized protein LOC133796210 n=1 Tax=Humulus lupulus TaxID=3486 RepID=UPI002B401DE6|nr:uncharacterized protein LOC133796210 [Humulus lupulus]
MSGRNSAGIVKFIGFTAFTCSALELIRIRLGFIGKLVVDRVGRSGGLCLFWTGKIDVNLIEYSRNYIDVSVTSHDSVKWRFTGLYGEPDSSLRHHFWNLLRKLRDQANGLWLVGGDINEILFDHEKSCGPPRSRYLMENFRRTLDYTGLYDLGYEGARYTWCNRHVHGNFTQARLDRMLCNDEWEEVRDKIAEVANDLTEWNSLSFKRTRFAMKKKKAELAALDKRLDNHSWDEYQKVEKELDLFTSHRPSQNSLDQVLNIVPSRVPQSMNKQLLHGFTEVDVRHALFQMNPRKSPGKDGMGAGFY